MQRVDCQISYLWYFRLIGGGLVSCGLISLVWIFPFLKLATSMDRETLRLINGTTYRWDQLRQVQHIRRIGSISGVQVDYDLELHFADGSMVLNVGDYRNNVEIIDFLEGVVGLEVRPHAAKWQTR